MMKTMVIALSLVALLLVVVAVSVAAPARAQGGLTAPANVRVVDGADPGTVTVSWDAVGGAQGYRIGWASYQAVQAAVADGIPWTERFAYTDVRSSVGSHTVANLMGGERYAFIVGTRQASGAYGWSEWRFHMMPSVPVCPAGGGQHPPGPPAPTGTPAPTATPSPRSGNPTIVFGDLNWSSALLQNRIAQYIVEKGYGYPTNVKFGATLPLFQGLRNGGTDVLMEIWLPNQNEAWDAAREAGAVISLGTSLGRDWQSAFVIPAYLQEQYPDLDNVEDLKDPQYKELFATADTGGKARLVSCIIGWACEDVNALQVEGYGLSDHVEIINPGDGAALNADLYGAYERAKPWLGYQWGTNDPALLLDLVRLEEPEYTDQCWQTTKACAYQDSTVLIAANPNLPAEAPDVVAMLRKWDFNIEIYKGVARWQRANPDADLPATALWWLNNNGDIWGQWVTPAAASAIRAALAAGEEAEGWPDE